jgi:hypothetical protein
MNDLHRADGQRAIADYALSSAGVASPSELAGWLDKEGHGSFGQEAALADLPFIMDLDQNGVRAENLSKSCDQAVLVDQTSGVGLPSDAVPVEIDRFG